MLSFILRQILSLRQFIYLFTVGCTSLKFHASWLHVLRPRERLRSVVTSMSVCVCVCLSVCVSVCPRGYLRKRAIFTKFLCMLPMSVARSSSGMMTIGRIAYRREEGDGSAQRGRSVIYKYCLVSVVLYAARLALAVSAQLHKYNIEVTSNSLMHHVWCSIRRGSQHSQK